MITWASCNSAEVSKLSFFFKQPLSEYIHMAEINLLNSAQWWIQDFADGDGAPTLKVGGRVAPNYYFGRLPRKIA